MALLEWVASEDNRFLGQLSLGRDLNKTKQKWKRKESSFNDSQSTGKNPALGIGGTGTRFGSAAMLATQNYRFYLAIGHSASSIYNRVGVGGRRLVRCLLLMTHRASGNLVNPSKTVCNVVALCIWTFFFFFWREGSLLLSYSKKWSIASQMSRIPELGP